MERGTFSQPDPEIDQENNQELAWQMNRPARAKSSRTISEPDLDNKGEATQEPHRKRLRPADPVGDLTSLPRDIIRYLHVMLAQGRPDLARRTVCIFRLVSKSWLKMSRALPIVSKPLTYESLEDLEQALENFNLVEIDLSLWCAGRSGCVPTFTTRFQDLARITVPYCNAKLLRWLSFLPRLTSLEVKEPYGFGPAHAVVDLKFLLPLTQLMELRIEILWTRTPWNLYPGVLTRLRGVRSFGIDAKDEEVDNLMAELYGMQPLRRLELSNLSLVSDRVTTLTTLEHLSWHSLPPHAFVPLVCEMTWLRSLDFSGHLNVSAWDALRHLRLLSALAIRDTCTNSNASAARLESLATLADLRSLSLQGFVRPCFDPAELAKLTQLTELHITPNVSGAMHLSGLTQLEILRLHDSEAIGMREVAYLSRLHVLHMLNFPNMPRLYFLAMLPQLEELALSGLPTLENRLTQLHRLFPTTLRRLSILNCKAITAPELQELLSLTRLEMLNLTGTPIPPLDQTTFALQADARARAKIIKGI